MSNRISLKISETELLVFPPITHVSPLVSPISVNGTTTYPFCLSRKHRHPCPFFFSQTQHPVHAGSTFKYIQKQYTYHHLVQAVIISSFNYYNNINWSPCFYSLPTPTHSPLPVYSPYSSRSDPLKT